jgi:hypothetical protein
MKHSTSYNKKKLQPGYLLRPEDLAQTALVTPHELTNDQAPYKHNTPPRESSNKSSVACKPTNTNIDYTSELMSRIKLIAEEFKNNNTHCVMPNINLFYDELQNSLRQDKYGKYDEAKIIKKATVEFQASHRPNERHSYSNRQQPTDILNLLFTSIEVINSQPEKIISLSNKDKDGYTIMPTKAQNTQFRKQKQKNRKIAFFQKHAGIIITHLFAKALRSIDIEWRRESQPKVKSEIASFFLDDLTQGHAQTVMKKYLKAQIERKQHFKKIKGRSYNTFPTIYSDCYYLIHLAKTATTEIKQDNNEKYCMRNQYA